MFWLVSLLIVHAQDANCPQRCTCEHAAWERMRCQNDNVALQLYREDDVFKMSVDCSGPTQPASVTQLLDGLKNAPAFTFTHLWVRDCPLWLMNAISNAHDLRDLTRLDLTFSPHLEVYGNTLPSLPALQILVLKSVPLAFFDDALPHFTNLRELHLGFNNLRRIPDGATHLPYLELLNLTHNEIAEVSETALQDLTRLRTLDLQHNQIPHVGAFTRLKTLTHLDLSNNQIATIPRIAFACLFSLRELKLDGNLFPAGMSIVSEACYHQPRSLSFRCDLSPRIRERQVRAPRYAFWTEERRKNATPLRTHRSRDRDDCNRGNRGAPMKCIRSSNSPVGTLYYTLDVRGSQLRKCAASVVRATSNEFLPYEANKRMVLTSAACIETRRYAHSNLLFVSSDGGSWPVEKFFLFVSTLDRCGVEKSPLIGFLTIRPTNIPISDAVGYFPLDFAVSRFDHEIRAETPWFSGPYPASCPLDPMATRVARHVATFSIASMPSVASKWHLVGTPWLMRGNIFATVVKTPDASLLATVFDDNIKAAYTGIIRMA